MKRGGRIINHGYKGIVMNIYNSSKKDVKTLYKEIENKDELELIGINNNKIKIREEDIKNAEKARKQQEEDD